MERSSARSACRVVTLRSADCQAEDKAGKIITSWQTSVIRKERPWLRWLSTPPPAMLLDGAPWRFPQSSPHLSYPFTRRHLGEDKKWTACSDLSSPCSRKHSTAHSSGEGPVSSWDNPSKPVLCSGLLCCFRNGGGQLLVLPPLPSPIIAAKNKLQSLWQRLFSCDQQQLCISIGRSYVIFLVKLWPLSLLIQITFCLLYSFYQPSIQETGLFFQPLSLCQVIAAYREKGLCLLCSLTIYCWFVSSSSDCLPVSRTFWLVFITFAFIANFPWFCLSCPSVSSWYL